MVTNAPSCHRCSVRDASDNQLRCQHEGKSGPGVPVACHAIAEGKRAEFKGGPKPVCLRYGTSYRWLPNTNFKGVVLDPAKDIQFYYSQGRPQSPTAQTAINKNSAEQR